MWNQLPVSIRLNNLFISFKHGQKHIFSNSITRVDVYRHLIVLYFTIFTDFIFYLAHFIISFYWTSLRNYGILCVLWSDSLNKLIIIIIIVLLLHLFGRKTITSKLHKLSHSKRNNFTLHHEHIFLALNHENNKKTDIKSKIKFKPFSTK